jgi:hypothetical protein
MSQLSDDWSVIEKAEFNDHPFVIERSLRDTYRVTINPGTDVEDSSYFSEFRTNEMSDADHEYLLEQTVEHHQMELIAKLEAGMDA